MDRLHAFDALRAATMSLVVIFHGSIGYMTTRLPDLPWAVYDRASSPLVDWLVWWIHGFQMPLFFFLAGFFAATLLDSRGLAGFVRNRAHRILAPFLLGCAVILPVTFAVFATGWLVSGQCTLREIQRMKFNAPIQSNLYGPAHLWFLEYLLVFYVGFVLVRWKAGAREAAPSSGPGRLDRLLLSGWRPLPWVLVTALLLWIDVDAAINVRNSFVPNVFRLGFYGLFFGAGACYSRFRGEPERFIPNTGRYLLLSVPVFAGMGWWLGQHLAKPLGGGAYLGLGIAIAAYGWLSIFGYVGLFARVFDRPHGAVRYASDASYWIYLSHLPVVGLAQIALWPLGWPAGVKATVVIVASVAVGLLSHRLLVRDTILGRLLNGRSRPVLAGGKRVCRLSLTVLVLLVTATPALADQGVIVAVGDSLTAGFGVAPDEAYPALLADRLRGEGYAYRIVNAGVSGDTTAGALRRLDWILRARPEIAIVALGANDGLRGASVETTRANLEQIVERLRKSGVRVLLAGMRMPANYGPEFTRDFAGIFPAVARRTAVALMPFLLEGVAGDPRLNQADGVHPNAQGHRVIAEQLWHHLRPLLRKQVSTR